MGGAPACTAGAIDWQAEADLVQAGHHAEPGFLETRFLNPTARPEVADRDALALSTGRPSRRIVHFGGVHFEAKVLQRRNSQLT